jgi:DHA1 family bicyclomycin/chloramphenicol resistance-like MFS transporter
MKQAFAKAMVLITLILMDLLVGAEIDLFVPSFPEIKSQFNLTTPWLEAMLSVNFVGFLLSLLFVGGLADRYGRKPIIMLGIATFVLGSAICLVESSYVFLLLGRFCQGLGAAAPATLSFLIIADTYPLKQQQYLMGVLNGIMNIAVAAAPVAGSYITMHFHWQGNFMALLILGLIVLMLVAIFIPQYKLPELKEPLSLREYFPLFKSKPLMLLLVNINFIYLPYWVFLGMSPLLYMEGLGVSLSMYGYYQGAWALVYALGSIFIGLIVNRYDPKKLLNISTQICFVGLAVIVYVTYIDSPDPLIITLAFLIYSLGSIIPNIIVYPLCLSVIPKAKGRAAALIRGVGLILTAIGLELTGYFYEGSFQNIGIIISFIVLIAVISQVFVTRNKEIMKLAQK